MYSFIAFRTYETDVPDTEEDKHGAGMIHNAPMPTNFGVTSRFPPRPMMRVPMSRPARKNVGRIPPPLPRAVSTDSGDQRSVDRETQVLAVIVEAASKRWFDR